LQILAAQHTEEKAKVDQGRRSTCYVEEQGALVSKKGVLLW
jgi:hypothetical protein